MLRLLRRWMDPMTSFASAIVASSVDHVVLVVSVTVLHLSRRVDAENDVTAVLSISAEFVAENIDCRVQIVDCMS